MITNLCLRDASCVEVCPVDAIVPGIPQEKNPTYYIDPDACIDCGACEAECPYGAIFESEEVPSHYQAKGGERISMPIGIEGFNEVYEGKNHEGALVKLTATRTLNTGEIIDLTDAIENNATYFSKGPGYPTQ